MPDFNVTSPDGKQFRVTAPDGASEADVLNYAQSQFARPTLGDIGTQAVKDITSFPGKLFDSIKSAVTLPADVITGKAMLPSSQGIPGSVEFGDPRSSGERVADMAFLGAGVNPAIRTGDRGIPGAIKAFTSEKPTPTVQQLGEAADKNFDRARTSGVEFNPQSVKNWALDTASHLDTEGRIDAPKVASGTHEILRRLQSIPEPEPGMPPAVQTISNLQAIRKSLQSIAQDVSPANKSDRAAASIAIDRLDKFISDASPQDIVAGTVAAPYAAEQWQNGRGNYAAAQRSNRITGELDNAYTGVMDRGQLRADVANSGQNTGNALRQNVASLLTSRKELQGYSPEEIAALERAASGTRAMNASRWIGNFMGGGGGLGAQLTSALGAGAGALLGNVPGAMAGASVGPVVGAGAKLLEGNLTKRAVSAADELIRQRSPLYQNAIPDMNAIDPARRAAIARLLALTWPSPQQ